MHKMEKFIIIPVITELNVYMIINEFLPKHSTGLPYEAENGSIYSAPTPKFQDIF